MADRARVVVVAAVAAMAVGCGVHVAPTVTIGALLAVLGVVLARAVVDQLRCERQRRAAPVVDLHGVRVHLHEGHGAWTAGPLHPVVFIGRTTVELLTDDELRAVVLHEEAHRRAHDPLLAVVRDVLVPVPGRQHVTARARARREALADRSALRGGASRSALARALLKMPAATPPAIGFTPATEARVRALLGEEDVIGAPRALPVAVGVVLGVLSCLATGHQLLMAVA